MCHRVRARARAYRGIDPLRAARFTVSVRAFTKGVGFGCARRGSRAERLHETHGRRHLHDVARVRRLDHVAVADVERDVPGSSLHAQAAHAALRKATAWARTYRWWVRLDVARFFPTIDHCLVREHLRRGRRRIRADVGHAPRRRVVEARPQPRVRVGLPRERPLALPRPHSLKKVLQQASMVTRVGADPEKDQCGASAILRTKRYRLEAFGRQEAAESKKQKKDVRMPEEFIQKVVDMPNMDCLLYTSPSPRDRTRSRMPSSA